MRLSVTHANQVGFSLIELIVVIVILGILAATALPKFITVSTDARVATVEHLAGSLRSTANMIYSLCYATPACDRTRSSQGIIINGVDYNLNYGWPDSGDALDSNQIDVHVNYEGFIAVLDDYRTTRFYRADAPDPANCGVAYLDAYGSLVTNRNVTIQATTSGC